MKEYDVTFGITQLANSPEGAARLTDDSLKDPDLEWIYIVQEQGTNEIFSIDLLDCDSYDISKDYYPEIIGNNLYTKQQMLEFAFNFYSDLSRKNNVPENLINENFTLVEEYFKETFNKL